MHTDPLPRLRDVVNSDLAFHDADSRYATHDFHAFPAKFPPQLPRAFIDALTRPGDLVLDPMVGSGTTLVEAYLSGRAAVGVDIDPLALLLCRVKTRLLPLDDLCKTAGEITRAARSALRSPASLDRVICTRYDEMSRAFIDFWFAPRAQRELMALLLAIEQTADPQQRDFFYLAFSAIIITKSGGVSLARDLAHTRPHRDGLKHCAQSVGGDGTPLSATMDAFERRVRRNINSLAELRQHAPSMPPSVDVLRGDARALPLRGNAVDLIITSPPYAGNAIDYMRAHKFSLAWFGRALNDLADLRGRYVGGERLRDATLMPLPPRVQDVVARLSAVDAKKGRVLHRYFSEMSTALMEMYRVLRPGGVAVVVVGSSTMRGIDVQTHHCLAAIAEEMVGFGLAEIAARALDRNRRMMPVSHNGSRAGIEGRMHCEHVIGLYKRV